MGRRSNRRPDGPRLPTEAAGHLQRDTSVGEDAERKTGVFETAAAEVEEPERRLLVYEYIYACARLELVSSRGTCTSGRLAVC